MFPILRGFCDIRVDHVCRADVGDVFCRLLAVGVGFRICDARLEV